MAYVSDPVVSKIFKPVAEQIMAAAKSIGNVEEKKLIVLQERMEGKTKREIADGHSLNLSIVENYEQSLLRIIAKTQPTLVKRLKEIRAMPFTEEGMEERKKVYEQRYAEKHPEQPTISKRRYCANNPEKRKLTCQKYYNEHKEEINRKNREKYLKEKESMNKAAKQRKEMKSNSDYLEIFERIKGEIFAEDEKDGKQALGILKRPGCGDHAKEGAILTIGARRYRKAFSSLLPYLRSPVPFLRKAAVWAFGEQQEVRAIPHILELAKRTEEVSDIIEIINTLKHMGNYAGLHALREVPHKGDSWIRERIDDAIMGFRFRDITKEDNSMAKLRSEYVKELIKSGILNKETYLKAHEIYLGANKAILSKYELKVSPDGEEETMIPVPLKAQRSLRMKYCMGKTKDPAVIKALLIIEKIREISGGRIKHNLIVSALDKFG